jgi:hypothetical protein
MERSLFVRPLLVALVLLVAAPLPYVVTANYPVGGKLVALSDPRSRPYVFPDGGRQLFPRYRMVALYGTPDTPALGALGQQSLPAALARVKALSRQYQPLVREHVLPTFEIIATVASASPADNGDYTYQIPLTTLQRWVAAARQAGVYVVLDLQPGRASFPSQAKQLSKILMEPNVGLALDPEWRLKPNQLPLEQIGSVSIGEVNQTVHWLAALVARYKLPQKLLLLHQFRLDMLPGRDQLDTSRPQLAYAIQMDGQGSPAAKLGTWQAMLADPPQNVHFGWKNFYKMDTSVRSPAATMKLTPQPWYVSYQ